MPGLARKVIIYAAVDGLILQPLNSKKEQRVAPPVKIKYGDVAISNISSLPDTSRVNSSFEAFGIIGLVTVSKFSYLVSITRRQQVAQIRGLPIYMVTEVALTPCSSYKDASDSVAKTVLHLQGKPAEQDAEESDSDDDLGPPSRASDDVGDESAPEQEQVPGPQSKSTVAQDVMTRRGSYGRFAQRWFSKSGWMQEQKRTMGLSNSEEAIADPDSKAGKHESTSEAAGVPVEDAEQENLAPPSLLPKLLRTTQILFGTSKSFFFSYDYDITRRLSNQKYPTTQSSENALYKQVDPLFFWNRNVLQPFLDSGAESLALPLMQGFFGQRTFTVDSRPPQVDDGAKESMELSDFGANWSNPASNPTSNPASPPNERASVDLRPSEKQFDITVISRRSVKRAGLRYLRRGIDDDGFVANSVESEQILCPKITDESTKVYSFVQIRGSIPLFFTQTPYSLRPTPVLRHSEETNYQALKKHFEYLHQRYGSLQIANLIEKHSIEAPIGQQFQAGVERYNKEHPDDEQIPFEWFDFHAVCRGMKFENVQKLIEILREEMSDFGSSVEANGEITSVQKGVIRTNCMDCLDRTNVCQSSFAKHMLDQQLKEQGFDMTVQNDQVNSWFNTLWADNGDAISKQYASTGAMKGDYTRTRKRDYRGALTDAGLSLTRFYNGMVNDFFLQATIDFLLGNVTAMVFEEFEATMMTKDPAVSVQKMRDQAIELCQKRVIVDEKEEFIGAWALLTPSTTDSITTKPFEEIIFMLTDTAMYLCRFDWNLDKVSSFERILLSHVENIKFGTYITSTRSTTQMDEMKNVGLVVTYKPGSSDIQRINTRSLSSLKSRVNSNSSQSSKIAGLFGGRSAAPAETAKKIALKAPYSQYSLATGAEREAKMSELQLVVSICAEIERLAFLNQPVSGQVEKNRESIIEKDDIVSLADAKKNVGLFDNLSHSIKRLVWA